MGGTTARRRHGFAGLLVALFVVAGIVFSYGLGHAQPLRVCTAHSLSVPVHHLPAGHADGDPIAASTPVDAPPLSPAEACLSLAVLLTMLTLALAARPRLAGALRLPRAGRSPRGPTPTPPSPVSLAALQVLRL
ncbi:hypothetical protein [Spirillospora sp. CA-294931]|uniref:hypothetical protein n=1 Tax=Spirillospora sp. CA-294931 TaxID=3240042 RepID=UPI003D91CFBB